jgi:hypothetical protein
MTRLKKEEEQDDLLLEAMLRIQTLLIRIRILLLTLIRIRIPLFNLIRIRICFKRRPRKLKRTGPLCQNQK